MFSSSFSNVLCPKGKGKESCFRWKVVFSTSLNLLRPSQRLQAGAHWEHAHIQACFLNYFSWKWVIFWGYRYSLFTVKLPFSFKWCRLLLFFVSLYLLWPWSSLFGSWIQNRGQPWSCGCSHQFLWLSIATGFLSAFPRCQITFNNGNSLAPVGRLLRIWTRENISVLRIKNVLLSPVLIL